MSFKVAIGGGLVNLGWLEEYEHQGTFDKDKGQKSAIRGAPSPLEALHWIFCFFSSIYMCNLVRRAP